MPCLTPVSARSLGRPRFSLQQAWVVKAFAHYGVVVHLLWPWFFHPRRVAKEGVSGWYARRLRAPCWTRTGWHSIFSPEDLGVVAGGCAARC